MIRLRTLGILELQRADGAPIEALLSQPKRLALLAYLAAATPRGFHRRDTLLALFWPEADQGHARAALRKAIHVLRRALGEGALLFRGDEELATNSEAVWCDVAAFDDAVAGQRWAEALGLYRGDLLEGFFVPSAPDFERWLERERARLRRQAEQVALGMAGQYDADGNVTGAVSAARRAVELGTDDERTVQRLITLLDRLGDRAGALHAYDRLAQHLATEYQAEPSPETQALIAHIRAREVLPVSSVDSRPPTPPGLPDVPGYQIERELGRGGMAVVYQARDMKHGRPVAVKVFQAGCAIMLGKERFLREIQITAQLAHPHILPLLDSGTAGGLLYYVMPLVRGESLRARLRREGPFEVPEAIRLVREVAEALDCAHRQGIVHRDVKPENILLQEGHAVVADFGVARAVTSSTLAGAVESAPVSSIRLAIGTRTYMSPEQADGGEVDARADIYSLACVLYELLAGEPPVAHNDGVTKIRIGRTDVGQSLTSAIETALAQRPAERFASVAEFADAFALLPSVGSVTRRSRRLIRSLTLGALGMAVLLAVGAYWLLARPFGAPPQREVPRLAVLPFKNLGPREQEYFADGITEEITARLAAAGGLGVISRTTAATYKSSTKAVRQIAAELGVDYILEGTVRWQPSPRGPPQVRVTPQLIRAKDDTRLWANAYDEVLTEVFAVQLDIAEQVARSLGIALRQGSDQPPTTNLEAYDYYLRALEYQGRGLSPENTLSAERMFQRATELDSGFALAYARLSRMRMQRYWYFWDHTPAALASAKEAADRAVRLSPNLSKAHEALGFYYYLGHLDYEQALREFAIALQGQPQNSDVLGAVAIVRRRQGRFDLAVRGLEEALNLDPRSAAWASNLGETYLLVGRFPEAEGVLSQAIALAPDWSEPYEWKLALYRKWEGHLEQARALVEEGSRIATVASNDEFIYAAVTIDLLEAKYEQALTRLGGVSSDALDGRNHYVPKAQLKAALYDLLHQPILSKAYADSARMLTERRLHVDSSDARFHSAVGISYARLGRKDDAIREGSRGVELWPITKDAYRGTYRLENLAQIYAMVGESDHAIDILESLLSRPSLLSKALLRIDPKWMRLRTSPRFQRFIQAP